ncbi:GLPGLI family protein [Aquiflexum lacus]|uniref:GLPGLI family protein n=1 Tax=Aquiflexum lacus TaxID=2483805 RepID=UPI001893CCEF|nr:GLPGLI family protein [Aquiflexum lacus]
MKKALLFIAIFDLCFFCEIFAQTSTYSFFYEFKFAPDSTDLDNRKEDLMVLWTNGTNSVFQSFYGFEIDNFEKKYTDNSTSIGEFNPQEFMNARRSMKQPQSKVIVHKNLPLNEMVYFDQFFFNSFRFKDQLWKVDWKITDDIRNILDKKCVKATTSVGGRQYEAWFTEEIPIGDGPFIFHGLPGLIVELYDVNNHYYFNLTGIEKKQIDMGEIGYPKAITTSKNKFFETKKKYFQDVRLGLGDRVNMVSPEEIASSQERYNKANNPIILKVD